MTEDQLKQLLIRNPQITARDNSTLRQISATESERRTPDALDPVVPGENESKAGVTVRFIFYRTRLLDVDAVASGSKDLLDGLQEAGLISGDRSDQIVFEASQKKVRNRKDEGTWIEISE